MIWDVNNLDNAVISIGWSGENKVKEILFNYSAWAKMFGPGILTLDISRPVNPMPYPITLQVDGDIATWQVSDSDTQYEGRGNAQLRYTVGEQVKKSAKFFIKINGSIRTSSEAPDPYQDWIEQVIDATQHYPKIVNGYWYIWDVISEEWATTNQKAQGEQGEKGDTGASVTFLDDGDGNIVITKGE